MDGYDDTKVALVAAACVIVFTLATTYAPYGLRAASVAVRMAPLVPYFVYLFTRRADLPPALDSPRNWSLLTVAVTLALLAYYAV